MILLDTHIWVWWTADSEKLNSRHKAFIGERESAGLGVSIISCREVAKLYQKGKIQFTIPLKDWFEEALSYPNVRILELNTDIIPKSIALSPNFHNDPADQLIAATSVVNDMPLLTQDKRMQGYSFLNSVKL